MKKQNNDNIIFFIMILAFIGIWMFIIEIIKMNLEQEFIITKTECVNETTAYDGCVLGCATGIIGSINKYNVNEAILMCEKICIDLIKQNCEEVEVDEILDSWFMWSEERASKEWQFNCRNKYFGVVLDCPSEDFEGKLNYIPEKCCYLTINKKDLTKEWLWENCESFSSNGGHCVYADCSKYKCGNYQVGF